MTELLLPHELLDVGGSIQNLGGKVYLVGGGVRDFLLRRPVKDFDFEVYGMSPDILKGVLEGHGPVRAVGKSFGVFLMPDHNAEFALPRRENKQGRGHKGFMVEFDPTMTTEEASRRRDFTINAMMIDLADGTLVDHHGGQSDLRNRELRATSEAYMEDPLRVLRGMQFISRFGLTATSDTIHMSRKMLDEADTLSKERIWWEWYKWSTGVHLADGLLFLSYTGWLSLWTALQKTMYVEQDPLWHPEGDVWTHTLRVVDFAGAFARHSKLSTEETTVLVFAALLHDVGKPRTTTTNERGRIIHPKHEIVGMDIAADFLESIGAPGGIVSHVLPLISEHMIRRGKREEDVTKRLVRRLATRLEPATIRMLTLLMAADTFGSGKLDDFGYTLNRVAAEVALEDAQPQPILKGRDLINEGLSPGPIFGKILDVAFEAQLDGEFDEDTATDWLKDYLMSTSFKDLKKGNPDERT